VDGYATDNHGSDIEWNSIFADLNPLCSEILRRKSKSIADLAIQAQAYALANFGTWFDPHLDEAELVEARLLVENVCSLTGTEPFPGATVIGIPADDQEEATGVPKQHSASHRGAPDPVFAAIQKHQKAHARLDVALDDQGKQEIERSFGEGRSADAKRQSRNLARRVDRSGSREIEAFSSLVKTRPATAIGTSVYVSYVRRQMAGRAYHLDQDDMKSFMEILEAVVTPQWVSKAIAANVTERVAWNLRTAGQRVA
jgi:hypothetical protein